MDERERTRISKFLSLVLRHRPKEPDLRRALPWLAPSATAVSPVEKYRSGGYSSVQSKLARGSPDTRSRMLIDVSRRDQKVFRLPHSRYFVGSVSYLNWSGR